MKTNCCSLFGHRIFLSTIYLRRPKAEKTIVEAEKKINKISLCCKTIKIQISSFAGFASIRQAPTELPRQAGEWRMLFEVLPSTLARAGNGGRRVWMMVVTWKAVGLGFRQNSHSRKLPISFLGRRLHGWYLGHKISTYIKAFVV